MGVLYWLLLCPLYSPHHVADGERLPQPAALAPAIMLRPMSALAHWCPGLSLHTIAPV